MPCLRFYPVRYLKAWKALHIYAGGLGILAGDYLKTASDLGLSVVGVGLPYQEGYFRQMIDVDGRQLARELHNWYSALILHWDQVHFGNFETQKTDNGYLFEIQVYLGEILPDQISVELYAEGIQNEQPHVI